MLRLKRILEERGVSLGKAALKIGVCKGSLSGIVNQTTPISTRSHKLITAYLERVGGDAEEWADWNLPIEKGVRMLEEDVLLKFGLIADPFNNEMKNLSEDCYRSDEARWVEKRLLQIIDNRGFCALVGPTGAGKSILAHRVFLQRPRLKIAKPRMCDTEMLHAGAIYDCIADDLGDESPKRSREARARQVYRILKATREASKDPLLMVDEADRLIVSTFKAMKTFYDEWLDGERLLSVLLVGQEKLETTILRADLLEVGRRCQIVHLHGLQRIVKGKKLPPTAGTVRDYLQAKLRRMGRNGQAVDVGRIFGDDALEALATRAPVPLHLNELAAKAMTQAYDGGYSRVEAEHVNEVG